MPITKTHQRARAVINFEVDGPESDTPVLFGADYTYQEQKIFPVSVVAEWSRRDGSWVLDDVRVNGYVQLKSGKSGNAYTERKAYRSNFRSEDGSWTDDTPDWLMVAVMNNAPE